jgi:hypothetical protein
MQTRLITEVHNITYVPWFFFEVLEKSYIGRSQVFSLIYG